MTLLRDLIKQVEDHTKESFNLNNRRHELHLNSKIMRLHEDRLRKLNLIETVLKSEDNENDLYNNNIQYIRKR